MKSIQAQIEKVLKEATPFQRRVYEVVLQIPPGQTRSYQWVAQKIGQPNAARAVGQALKRNPLPFRPGRMAGIPCHRVVASDGSLGGFSSGLKLKRRLLELEKIKNFNGCF